MTGTGRPGRGPKLFPRKRHGRTTAPSPDPDHGWSPRVSSSTPPPSPGFGRRVTTDDVWLFRSGPAVLPRQRATGLWDPSASWTDPERHRGRMGPGPQVRSRAYSRSESVHHSPTRVPSGGTGLPVSGPYVVLQENTVTVSVLPSGVTARVIPPWSGPLSSKLRTRHVRPNSPNSPPYSGRRTVTRPRPQDRVFRFPGTGLREVGTDTESKEETSYL